MPATLRLVASLLLTRDVSFSALGSAAGPEDAALSLLQTGSLKKSGKPSRHKAPHKGKADGSQSVSEDILGGWSVEMDEIDHVNKDTMEIAKAMKGRSATIDKMLDVDGDAELFSPEHDVEAISQKRSGTAWAPPKVPPGLAAQIAAVAAEAAEASNASNAEAPVPQVEADDNDSGEEGQDWFQREELEQDEESEDKDRDDVADLADVVGAAAITKRPEVRSEAEADPELEPAAAPPPPAEPAEEELPAIAADAEALEAAGNALNQAGYTRVVAQKSSPLMAAFIKLVIQANDGEVKDMRSLVGFAPYHSGEKAVQTFDEMMKEIREQDWNSLTTKSFDPANAVASATLDEEGYQNIATLHDTEKMGGFIEHFITANGGRVLDPTKLSWYAKYHSGEKATQSFKALVWQLKKADWITDMVFEGNGAGEQ